MVIKRLRYSGAYKMFIWVAKALADRGFDVTVFTFMSSDISEFPSSKVKWIQQDLGKKGFFSKLNALRNEIKSINPSVSISFLLDANVLNILACLGLKTKSIVCERNDPFKPGYYKLKILKPFFRLAKGAVFQLPKVTEFYKNIKAPTAVIPNPVLCCSNVRALPFNLREKKIVTLGRLDMFQKRQDMLLQAFKRFLCDYPDYRLEIWGDGPDEQKIQQLIHKLELDESVKLCGVTHTPQKTIQNAKIFVLTSDFEGIPNALIEAMSIGLPCISTDCSPGGASLLIQNGKNGCLVPVGDVDTLYKKIKFLVENKEFADSVGMEAVNIAETYSEMRIGNMWERYILSVRD